MIYCNEPFTQLFNYIGIDKEAFERIMNEVSLFLFLIFLLKKISRYFFSYILFTYSKYIVSILTKKFDRK